MYLYNYPLIDRNPDLAMAKKRQRAEKSAEDAVPLPEPFPLPKHFGVVVEAALKSHCMTTAARRGFAGKVIASMLLCKRYLTRDD